MQNNCYLILPNDSIIRKDTVTAIIIDGCTISIEFGQSNRWTYTFDNHQKAKEVLSLLKTQLL